MGPIPSHVNYRSHTLVGASFSVHGAVSSLDKRTTGLSGSCHVQWSTCYQLTVSQSGMGEKGSQSLTICYHCLVRPTQVKHPWEDRSTERDTKRTLRRASQHQPIGGKRRYQALQLAIFDAVAMARRLYNIDRSCLSALSWYERSRRGSSLVL